jgi:hypothetical protein
MLTLKTGCGLNGWNSTEPQCARAQCPERSLRFGSLRCQQKGQLKCTYECDDGYSMFPLDFDPEIKCRRSNLWSKNETPICKPKTCPPLPEENNGDYHCQKVGFVPSVKMIMVYYGFSQSGKNAFFWKS